MLVNTRYWIGINYQSSLRKSAKGLFQSQCHTLLLRCLAISRICSEPLWHTTQQHLLSDIVRDSLQVDQIGIWCFEPCLKVFLNVWSCNCSRWNLQRDVSRSEILLLIKFCIIAKEYFYPRSALLSEQHADNTGAKIRDKEHKEYMPCLRWHVFILI